MAQLTWRNVAAPDFSTSLDGIRTASSMLDKAFSTASGTINNVDQSISSRINKSLLAQMAAISDPENAEAQIQQLLAGVDPRRLSTETIMFGAGRPDDLIAREDNRFDLATKEYNQGRVERRNTALDASEPIRMALSTAYQNNDKEGVAKYSAQLREVEGLQAGDYMAAVTGGQNLRSGDQQIRASDLSFEKDQYGFGRDKMNDAVSDKAAEAMAFLRENGFTTVDSALNALGKMNLDERTYNAVAEKIMPLQFINPDAMDFTGAGAGGGVSTAGGNAGASALTIMNYEARAKGFNSVPDSVKTLGQASDFALQVNKAGASSSAMGLYQIVGDTMRGYAPKVLGKDWRNAEFNLENQDKLARAIFEDNNGSADALRKQWVSLSPAEAEQVRKLPWEEARQVIARKESGGDPRALFLTGAAEQAGQDNRIDQITGDPVVDNWYGTVGKSSSEKAVAARLTGKGGAFEGQDKAQVEDFIRKTKPLIQEIMEKAGKKRTFNNDQVALLLENSMVTNQGPAWMNWLDEAVGLKQSLGNQRVDMKLLESNVMSILTGEHEKARGNRDRAGLIGQESAAARLAYDRQVAKIQAMRANRVNPSLIAAEEAKLVQLEKGLMGVRAQHINEGDAVSEVGGRQAPMVVPQGSAPAPKLPSEASRDFVQSLMVKKGPIKTGVPEWDRAFQRFAPR